MNKNPFDEFFIRLCLLYCNHGTMSYANYLFLNEFVNDKKELPNLSFQAQFSPTGDHMNLTPQKTKELIEKYREMVDISYYESISEIWRFNGHLTNDRAIVDAHILICKYFKDRDRSELYPFYDKHDWFKILLILRNGASHGWYITGHGLRFPDSDRNIKNKCKPFNDKLEFDTIILERGQKYPINVNPVNVSNLLSHIVKAFYEDSNFNPHVSHIQNPVIPKQ